VIVVKGILLIVLSIISFQDIKSREVYGFLFPLAGLCMTTLFYNATLIPIYSLNIGVNIGIILFILGIVYAYTTLKLKLNFWKEAFGLGDALFFIAFAIGFPIVSFLVLFVVALLFSLSLGVFFRLKTTIYTVPLAGYMSVFLSIVFVVSWLYPFNLYLV